MPITSRHGLKTESVPPAKQKGNSRLLRLLIGVAIFAVLVWVANPVSLWNHLQQLTPIMLAIIVGGIIATLIVNAIINWWLVQSFKAVALARVSKWYVLSWSTEFFLPGKLGVFSIAYFMQREGVKLGEMTAVVVLIKMLTLIIMLLAGISGYAIFSTFISFPVLVGGIIVLLAGMALALFTAFGKNILRRIAGILFRGFAEKFHGFSHAQKQLLQNPLRVGVAALLVFVSLAVNSFFIMLLFAQAGQHISLWQTIVVMAISQLIGAIPISLNGLGIKEGTNAFLFSRLGVPLEVGVLLSTLNTAVGILVALLVSTQVARLLPDFVSEKKE